MNDTHKELLEKYVCPGCVSGSNTDCGQLDFRYNRCENHVPGTFNGNFVKFCLGLPNGFNRLGEKGSVLVFDSIEEQRKEFPFDIFNLPVWNTEDEENLITKVVTPRIANTLVVVIANAKKEDILVENKSTLTDITLKDFDFKSLSFTKEHIEMMD